MDTLIIRASDTIANPIYGKVPDLSSDLRLVIDVRELSKTYNYGDRVPYIDAGILGYAPPSEKIFDKNLNYNYSSPVDGYPNFPLYTEELGFPTLKFSGFEGIAQDSSIPESGTVVTTATYVCLVQSDTQNGANNRIFSGDTSDTAHPDLGVYSDRNYHSVSAYVGTNNMTMAVGKDIREGNQDTTPAATIKYTRRVSEEPQVMVFVFDGENSFAVFGESASTKYNVDMPPAANDHLRLGSYGPMTKKGDTFFGHIGYFAQYSRAFTFEEAQAAIVKLSREFGLSNGLEIG
ncbi:MAG: hypothetical protein L0G63_03150 [Psychrobacter sp.]|uniref:hypothetical protein n=1 Tax=Psychrobacter sp. TaxID=56811 RepID=UPI002649F203|nr:hypothetical protein [Psychrobacter sp.]MDN5619430.1 hypothetical protein [Psychrobacter sp.]MDN5619470.1 hypothetical protein [Psychrobacter sp.]